MKMPDKEEQLSVLAESIFVYRVLTTDRRDFGALRIDGRYD